MKPRTRLFLFLFLFAGVTLPPPIHSQPNNQSSNNEQKKTESKPEAAPEPAVRIEAAVNQTEADDAYKARQEEREIAKQKWDKFGVVLNSLLFVAVLIGTWLTYRQVLLTKAIVGHTFDAERAYVGVKHIELGKLVQDASPSAYAMLVNGGKTPAFDVKLVSSFSLIRADEPTRHLPVGETTVSDLNALRGSFLSSEMEKRVEFSSVENFTEGNIKGIVTGEGKLLCFISIYYKDVRNIDRKMDFRYRFDAANDKFVELLD